MANSTVAHHLHEPAAPVTAKLDPLVTPVETSAPGFKLPFDPLRLLDAVFRYRWHALGAGVICAAALGSIVSLKLTTRHVASAQLIKLAPQNSLRQSEGGDPYTPHEVTLPNMIAIMWSGPVLEGAARRLDGRITASTLRAGLTVQPERNTDIIHVSMNSDLDRETAHAALQAYLEESLHFTRTLQQFDAASMATLLTERIAKAETEIAVFDKQLLDYATREGVVDPDKQTDALLGEIANHNLRYQTIRLDHETLDLRIAEIESELAKVSPAAAKLQQAREELASMRLRYTDEHPAMRNTLAAVEALEAEVERESSEPRPGGPPRPGESAISGSLYLDLVKLRGEKRALAEQLTKLDQIRVQLETQVGTLPRKSLELANIRAQKQAAETSRDLLAARLREARLVEERADGAFRILSMQKLDEVAVSTPKEKVIIASAGGFFGGAGLVAFLAAIFVLFDRRIGSAGDLKRFSDLPVLGQIDAATLADEAKREEWAFSTWTRLVPKLRRRERESGVACGLITTGPGSLAPLLASAAARRGASVLLLSGCGETAENDDSPQLDETLGKGEAILAHLQQRPESFLRLHLPGKWLADPTLRASLLGAIAHWEKSPRLVVLVELTDPAQPSTLLFAEALPNLIWLAKGHDEGAPITEAVRLYRAAGCALSGAVLEAAPPYRLKPLRHLEPLLGVAKAIVAAAILFSTSGHVGAAGPLLLGPGDKVNIRFAGAPELSREGVTVAPDGTLTYLHLQSLPVAGLGLDGLRATLNHELARYYQDPRISVTPNLFNTQRVYVLGKIVRKGVVPLDRPMRILDVVAAAGGLETGLFQQNTVELADLRRSFLARGGQRVPLDFEALFLKGDTRYNAEVMPGDYLYFPSANSNEIHVFGNVKSQGSQGLLAHTSVHSAIAQAGGFSERAYKRKILVVRGSLEHPETFVVDMEALLSARDYAFTLEPKDIVYVADHPWSRAEELIEIALNTFSQGAVSAWAGANIGSFSGD